MGRSHLFMNVKIGTPRCRQTSKSLRVCASMPFGGVDHHHHRIDGGQDAVGVFGKSLWPRRVEQVDAVAVVIELQDGGTDRDAALALQFHPVGGGGALVLARGNGAGEVHRAAVEQQLLRERGLARVRMRDDGKSAVSLLPSEYSQSRAT